jgi:hypothetical protein
MSKRKAYNPVKQLNRMADHLLKNVVVVYVDHLKGCVMVDTKRKIRLKPSQAMVASINRPHKWSCFIAAFGRTPHDEYFKGESIITPAKYYQADLAPIFEMHHQNLIKRIPEHQLCGVGWIADPFGNDLSEKDAGEIFSMLDAWN